MRLELAAGGWSAELRPERGGAITALRRRDVDVLRPTPVVVADPFELACFALVPYANRIADGKFAVDGRAVRLAPNHPHQAHPLHGVGWLVPWQVEAADAASATLAHAHAGEPAWPWAYDARQTVRLTGDGLEVTLKVTNREATAMPVSLGFHPYLTRAGVRSIGFVADGVWLADAAMLPTELAPADALGDWSAGGGLERDDLVDHCYSGWGGSVLIARDDGDVSVRAAGASLLHVYVPPGENFFCVEPVTAMPDAVNRQAAELLAPGETRTISMTIGA